MLSRSSISVKFVENGGFSQIPEVYLDWNYECFSMFTVYIEESTNSSEGSFGPVHIICSSLKIWVQSHFGALVLYDYALC